MSLLARAALAALTVLLGWFAWRFAKALSERGAPRNLGDYVVLFWLAIATLVGAGVSIFAGSIAVTGENPLELSIGG